MCHVIETFTVWPDQMFTSATYNARRWLGVSLIGKILIYYFRKQHFSKVPSKTEIIYQTIWQFLKHLAHEKRKNCTEHFTSGPPSWTQEKSNSVRRGGHPLCISATGRRRAASYTNIISSVVLHHIWERHNILALSMVGETKSHSNVTRV